MTVILRYYEFFTWMVKCALKGSAAYYIWMAVLGIVLCIGGFSYYHHLTEGLITTNMNNSVSWGVGIANFVFFVGVAAAAAALVVPAYAFKRADLKEVVLLGELLAVSAVVMCLLFIAVDVGRPERMWHLIPPVGILNVPSSMLSFDVVVFTVYLFLNLHIPGYLLYKMYHREKPWWPMYLPLVFLSMIWAVSIHTVTAFLLSGLSSRPFWNSAILAPRFIISAFASGPAILILIFEAIRHFTDLPIKKSVFTTMTNLLRVTMPANFFLLGCEVFTEFYPGAAHNTHAQYLFFGYHGFSNLTGFIWTAISMNFVATTIFLVEWTRKKRVLLWLGCVLTIAGIYIEKGVGLIFTGFTPDPIGQMVEYSPNLGEMLVSFGVLALGAMMFTVMAKVATSIQSNKMHKEPSQAERLMDQARSSFYTGHKIKPPKLGSSDYRIPSVPVVRPQIPGRIIPLGSRLKHRLLRILNLE